MAIWSDPRDTAPVYPRQAGMAHDAVDAGLRSYMLSVYNYMASGVALTGLVSMLFARAGYVQMLVGDNGRLSGLGLVAAFSPLIFVLVLSFGINRISTAAAQALYWAYAAIMGVSLSTIFLAYTNTSIATTFFATAGAFAGLSLYGYTTKRDLSGWGTFLIMGVVGIIIASIINIVFVKSTMMSLIISFIGVLLFAGLTAYDTQKIKTLYYQVAGSQFMGKAVVMGALTLYLDFINMFLFLLRLIGDRR